MKIVSHPKKEKSKIPLG